MSSILTISIHTLQWISLRVPNSTWQSSGGGRFADDALFDAISIGWVLIRHQAEEKPCERIFNVHAISEIVKHLRTFIYNQINLPVYQKQL